MKCQSNIYLIGPMAAGKTTIGKQLAMISGFNFFDVDEEIEKSAGMSIPTIFFHEQVSGFRRHESDMLAQLVKKQHCVISTGGGCVGSEINRRLLANGIVIYLKVLLVNQLARLQLQSERCQSQNRPLLQDQNPSLKLQELFVQRQRWYEELASLSYQTDDYPSPEQVVQQIFQDLCKNY